MKDKKIDEKMKKEMRERQKFLRARLDDVLHDKLNKDMKLEITVAKGENNSVGRFMVDGNKLLSANAVVELCKLMRKEAMENKSLVSKIMYYFMKSELALMFAEDEEDIEIKARKKKQKR